MNRCSRRQLIIYSFLLPSFSILIIFRLIPFIQGIYYCLCDYPLLQGPKFIGLGNFIRLWNDPLFIKSLLNTLYYIAGSIPPRLILGLVLALILNEKIKGRTMFRAIFYFPVIAPMVTVAMIWRWLFNTHFGLVNQILALFRIPPIPWLTNVAWAMPAIIIMSIWKIVGWNMVVFLAGLQGIPSVLYEAGVIDGASGWRSFRHITLPLLKPTMLLALVMSTISASQVFEQVYIMTGGGPGYATMTLVQQVYTSAFQQYELGYAAAIAFVLFLIVLSLTLVQFKYLGGEVEY